MKTNVKPNAGPVTHEGGAAVPSNPKRELRRAILACLLWEDQFYESGQTIADRIAGLCGLCPLRTLPTLLSKRELSSTCAMRRSCWSESLRASTHDTVGGPKGMTKGYMINVASAKNGVGYGAWTRLDGFSEAILTYI